MAYRYRCYRSVPGDPVRTGTGTYGTMALLFSRSISPMHDRCDLHFVHVPCVRAHTLPVPVHTSAVSRRVALVPVVLYIRYRCTRTQDGYWDTGTLPGVPGRGATWVDTGVAVKE